MTDTMTETAPQRIWLQIDPNGDPADRSEPCPDPADVELTWCWTQVGGQEVEYVRADLVRDAMMKAEAALADIGDADREPGDDIAWCERRAAQALPAIRAALAMTANA